MSAKTVAEIAVIADTKQAVEEMKKLAAATGKTFDEIKKQVDGVKELGNKWGELSKSMVGLQLHDAFTKISNGAKEATGGVLDLNLAFAGYKVAGPWGAAVGAVGVAVAKTANLMDGLGVSIDELEKKAQKQAIEKMPEWAKSIWATRDATQAMNDRLRETPGAIADVFASFSKLYPLLQKSREEIEKYNANAGALRAVDIIKKAGSQSAFYGSTLGGAAGAALQAGMFQASPTSSGSKQWFNDSELNRLTDELVKRIEAEQRFSAGLPGIGASLGMYGSSIASGLGGVGSDIAYAAGGGSIADQLTAKWNRALNPQWKDGGGGVGAGIRQAQESQLSKMFGPIEEFNAYKTAFDSLGGAVGASLSAWIDGSMSAGEAFKKFIGEALKALSVQMAMEALKHGAYALGSLAFGDVRGAAQHGQAALAFGAGAAVAAVAAKEFHSGGSTPGGGARPAAPNVVGGDGGGGGGPERIIVYADQFADESPRARQLQAKKMVSRALGNSAVEHS